MDPVLIQFGGLEIRWYGVMAAAAFLAATYFLNKFRKYANLSSEQASGCVFTALIAGIVGARIFFVALNWSHYKHNLIKIFAIQEGGLVFYGGFFLALIALFIYCRCSKLSTIRVMDLMAPALALAHGISRIGCLLNGCCYGKPTTLFWGWHYPTGTAPYLHYGNVPLHPVQLYETFADLILAWLLYSYLRKGAPKGAVAAAYCVGYGILRFLDELFRGDHPETELVMGLSPAQLIGIAIVPIGVVLWCLAVKHARKEA